MFWAGFVASLAAGAAFDSGMLRSGCGSQALALGLRCAASGGVVSSSTVHRAQGSERRIVIFDPVRPSSKFVAGVVAAAIRSLGGTAVIGIGVAVFLICFHTNRRMANLSDLPKVS